MIRSLVGYAVFAVVALVFLKVIFALFGVVVGLLGTLLWFAVIGFLCYLALKVISPDTADRVKEMIRGKSAA